MPVTTPPNAAPLPPGLDILSPAPSWEEVAVGKNSSRLSLSTKSRPSTGVEQEASLQRFLFPDTMWREGVSDTGTFSAQKTAVDLMLIVQGRNYGYD